MKDCNKITDEFWIGHVPPFVPLAAVKNAVLAGKEDVCEWFDADVHQCNIPKSVLDRLVVDTFEVDGTIKFTPPKILPGLPAWDPKSTYYKLEYLGDPVACADNNCRGPHYCSKAAAEEDVWGDFCPYIHTGENSGLYRHPHVALAAFELWIANKCKPKECPSTWLDSPNAKDYGADAKKSTSITWSEMDDNSDPMAQPIVPYQWPNAGDGIYPGHELYSGLAVKPAAGTYVTKFVLLQEEEAQPADSSLDGANKSDSAATTQPTYHDDDDDTAEDAWKAVAIVFIIATVVVGMILVATLASSAKRGAGVETGGAAAENGRVCSSNGDFCTDGTKDGKDTLNASFTSAVTAI